MPDLSQKIIDSAVRLFANALHFYAQARSRAWANRRTNDAEDDGRSAPDEVAALLREALAQLRTIRAAPPPDDTKTKLLIALDQIFKLTPAESRALVALMEQKSVSREAMCAAVARDGNPVSLKVVSVVLGTLRRKLRPYGIEVITVWARGFRLADNAHDEIHKLLTEHGAGIPPPVDRQECT